MTRFHSLALNVVSMVAAIAWIGAGPAPESLGVPFDLPLGDATLIALVLDHADLRVRVDEQAIPGLRARLAGTPKPRPTVRLEVQRTGRKLLVRRATAEAPDAPRPPIALELVVRSRHRLELEGRALGIEITAPLPTGTRSAGSSELPEHGTLPPARWHLRLDDSQARLVGTENARIEARDGLVELIDTTGALQLAVTGSTVEVERHHGYLHLDAEQAEVKLHHLRGAFEIDQHGGSVEGFDLGETLVATADQGTLSVQGWGGKATLHGSQSRMVVEGGRANASLTLTGRELDAEVHDHAGPLQAQIEGGSLRATTLEGPIEAKGHAHADIDIEQVEERVDMTLEDASAGHLVDIRDRVYVKVDDSRVEVDGAEHFGARGENAEATVRNIARLEIVSFKNSRIDLDLTQIQHHPALALKAATEAHVRMPMPCSVRVAGPAFAIENKVRVTGCALYTRGHMPPRDKLLRSPDERALVVNVVEDGSLDVEGVVLE